MGLYQTKELHKERNLQQNKKAVSILCLSHFATLLLCTPPNLATCQFCRSSGLYLKCSAQLASAPTTYLCGREVMAVIVHSLTLLSFSSSCNGCINHWGFSPAAF